MLRSSVARVTRRHVVRSLAATQPRLTQTTARNALTIVRCFSPGSSWDDTYNKSRGINQDGTAQPWQAEGALDIQRVTQQAMIHELIQQQTNTIQSVVPWFLKNMQPSYFRQVPEKFRVDHIKAIAAIKGGTKK